MEKCSCCDPQSLLQKSGKETSMELCAKREENPVREL